MEHHARAEGDIQRLWEHYHERRDPAARNRLVVHYAPLVKYVAGRVAAGLPSSVERGDLTSEGIIGLMDAIDKFEPERGFQFQTYAVRRIKGAMVDSLRAADWAPRSVRARQREEQGQDVAVQAQVPVGHASELERLELADELPGGLGGPPADEETRAVLAEAIRDLPERDAVVIALYYFEGLTLSEVGQVLSVSESRVSQLHSRATHALRGKLHGAASR